MFTNNESFPNNNEYLPTNNVFFPLASGGGVSTIVGKGANGQFIPVTGDNFAEDFSDESGCSVGNWWSLGALAYEMMIGNPPFQSNNDKDLDNKRDLLGLFSLALLLSILLPLPEAVARWWGM